MKKLFFKFATNFGPLVIFLYIYYNSGKDLIIAIPPLIIATLISLAAVGFFEKKIAIIPLFGGFFITLFGGLTIYFDNPIFIYLRPTILNISIGLVLLFGKYFTKESVIKKILGNTIPINQKGWKIFNQRWVLFAFGLALLNEIVWRTQSEEFWVNFKVWGITLISLFFAVFQIKLIKKYKIKKN
jgi:intracellular septation protein|tara:strand:- start:930 stop:1484 length:555 start_codon:yes stop_codon:yes gene_type:complete